MLLFKQMYFWLFQAKIDDIAFRKFEQSNQILRHTNFDAFFSNKTKFFLLFSLRSEKILLSTLLTLQFKKDFMGESQQSQQKIEK